MITFMHAHAFAHTFDKPVEKIDEFSRPTTRARARTRAQVREFKLAYASIFFKFFLLREIHEANFRRDVIYTFSNFKDGEAV